MEFQAIRKRLTSAYFAFILVTVGFLGLSEFVLFIDEGDVEAVTLTVGPGQSYTSIGAAITAANPGDTVRVHAGTYNENVVIDKRLDLIGNGTTNTTIDGGGIGDVVEITADGVNISGFRIINSGDQTGVDNDAGIELDTVENVTVTNNNCSNNNIGIHLRESHWNIIENNTCDSSDLIGIYILASDWNDVKNNSCKSNGLDGVRLEFSHMNWIDNNILDFNNESSIILLSSDSNTIEDNIGNMNGWYCIYIEDSHYTIIENNILNSNNGYGIGIISCESTTVSNNHHSLCSIIIDGSEPRFWNTHTIDTSNTVNGNLVYYRKFQSGGTIPADAGQIILSNCTNIRIENQSIVNTLIPIEIGHSTMNTIIDTTLSNNVFGIYLRSSNSNTIKNNDCESTFNYGLRLALSSHNIITNNMIQLNDVNGMDLWFSDNNTVNNNTLSSNGQHGIYLLESGGNSISHNIIDSNDEDGIFFNSSNLNTITNNNISSNIGHGISIVDSNNNDIYFNNIISNGVQANEAGTSLNNWDNGNGEGNHWSDYIGQDNGTNDRTPGDGIGDTNIPHLGLDDHPFMISSGWLYPGIPILSGPTEFDNDGNYTLSWSNNRGTSSFFLEEDNDYNFNSPITTYQGSELSYNVENKPNGTLYYRLKAFSDNHESEWSNKVNVTVDWIPSIPQEFQISAYPLGNALNISWKLNPTDTKEYELYSNITGTWKILESITHPSHTFDHTLLSDEQMYFYMIRSRDFRNQLSEFTDVISGIPMDSVAPGPPTGLRIHALSYDSITLLWNLSQDDDTVGYNIYRGNILNPDDWGDLIGTTMKGQENYTDSNLTELTTYYYTISAFDEIPHESNYSTVISVMTILGPHGPELNHSQEDFELVEDTYDGTTINLYNWFNDINGDTLTFRCQGQAHINVTIYQDNGTVILRPEKNWNGQETLIFYAHDELFNISDDVTITVTPVNDLPGPAIIIRPGNQTEFTHDQPIHLEAVCTDPDLPYGDDLTFTWSSSISGDLGVGDNLTNIKLPAGDHIITLVVTDQEGMSSTATVHLTVLKDLGTEGDDPSYLVLSIVVLIIVIALILILFIILRRKKEEQRRRGEEKEKLPFIESEIIPPEALQQPPPTTPTSTHEEILPSYGHDVPQFGPSEATMLEPPSTEGEQLVMDAQQEYPELPPAMKYPQSITPRTGFTETLEWGKAYILITKELDFGLGVFENQLEIYMGQGLCITRTHPSKLKMGPFMDPVTKFWLSKTSEENSISPGNLTRIAHVINEFLKNNQNCIILLDGLEYLISNNDFIMVLKFIQSIHERIVLNNAILLVPINPSALIKKNYELLENEITSIIKDPENFESIHDANNSVTDWPIKK